MSLVMLDISWILQISILDYFKNQQNIESGNN